MSIDAPWFHGALFQCTRGILRVGQPLKCVWSAHWLLNNWDAPGDFCCYSCGSSLVLCGKEMCRKRKLSLLWEKKVGSQQHLWVHNIVQGRIKHGAFYSLIQELHGLQHILDYTLVLRIYSSTLRLSTSTFTIFSGCYENDRSHYSLFMSQLSKWYLI